jgi:hypothetical protein
VPKIRFYHIKTLLWTYIVWAAINLWWAFVCCDIAKCALTRIPYYLAVLHGLPLYGLIRTLWECDIGGFILFVPGSVAGFAVVAGLLIKGRWARFLIIIGMSIWFLYGIFILGLGA